MTAPELSRMVKAQAIAEEPYDIGANAAERAALAARFNLPEITSLRAILTLTPGKTAIAASGSLTAAWIQSCATSGEEFPVTHRENITLRFVPARKDWSPDEEVELTADELDELEYEGGSFDLGEAVAQSFGLAVDPYATGPSADATRKEKGLLDQTSSGPFAALAALKKS